MVVSLLFYIAIAELWLYIDPGFRGLAPHPWIPELRLALLGISFLIAFLIPVLQRRTLLSHLAREKSPEKPLLTSTLIAHALCEVPALLGFVLFLMGGERMDVYLFTAISLVLAYLHFPRYERWKAWWQRR